MITIKPIEKIIRLRATVEVEMKETIQYKHEDDVYDLEEDKASVVEAKLTTAPHKLASEDLEFKKVSNVEVKRYE